MNKVKNTIIIDEGDFGNQQLPATSKLPSIGREPGVVFEYHV